jgi:hypothetical protein
MKKQNQTHLQRVRRLEKERRGKKSRVFSAKGVLPGVVPTLRHDGHEEETNNSGRQHE